ncbi:unnamed protein product, partial [Vitis vinifera]|uniref:Uncharacterized protein n=1 Tax=Vitis vinifera TaxID=29760 RepID=D7T3S8_VITVI
MVVELLTSFSIWCQISEFETKLKCMRFWV